jgi:hypothetical protein
MDALDAVLIVGLVGCFVIAVALAVSEVSIIRVRRSRVLVDAGRGDHRSRQLLGLLDDIPVVLNSVLLLALTAQVGSATIAGSYRRMLAGGCPALVIESRGERIPVPRWFGSGIGRQAGRTESSTQLP